MRLKTISNFKVCGFNKNGLSYGWYKGVPVIVKNGIPGESADVILKCKYSGVYEAEITDFKFSSPKRTNVFCRYAGICGGCNWQHIHYSGQLEMKRANTISSFKKRNLEATADYEIIPSAHLSLFRHRMEYSFSNSRWFYEGEGQVKEQDRLALGFFVSNRHDRVVDIHDCQMQGGAAGKIRDAVRDIALRTGFGFYDYKKRCGFFRTLIIRCTLGGEIMVLVGFAEDEEEKISSFLYKVSAACPEITSMYYYFHPDFFTTYKDSEMFHFAGTSRSITEKINGLSFRISPQSFFQGNLYQLENFLEVISEFAGLHGTERVYDLYTGTGTIACSLASGAAQVTGIEGNKGAVEDAMRNTEINHLHNVNFICGDILETFTEKFVQEADKPDLVVLDPPRSGTLIEIKKSIILAAPRKIIYVSCDPVSLARDAEQLSSHYEISRMKGIDMFPHTPHSENIVLYTRRPFI